jgi:hypothetical protein
MTIRRDPMGLARTGYGVDAPEGRMAVAVGFEPTEGCPSHAFEACSLGRSDTPPRVSVLDGLVGSETGIGVAVGLEELPEDGAALVGEHARHHLGPVVEPAVADEVPQ